MYAYTHCTSYLAASYEVTIDTYKCNDAASASEDGQTSQDSQQHCSAAWHQQQVDGRGKGGPDRRSHPFTLDLQQDPQS